MKRSHLLIISAIFLFYVINNFIWLLLNKLPFSYDEGVHLWMNIKVVKALIHPVHDIFYDLWHADITHWPPLFYFVASLLNLILGTSYVVSVMTNMLFFLLLIISLYLIGKRICSPSVGILAVSILSFYPIIYGHSRLFLLDVALAGMVTFSVYCLVVNHNFENLYWSIILGIGAGLGMLTKWSYAAFILPLFIYTVMTGLQGTRGKELLCRTKNLLTTIIIAFSVSFIWYSRHIEAVIKPVTQYIESALPSCSLFEYVKLFILTFNAEMLSFTFFMLFVSCLVLLYMKRDFRFKRFISIWWFFPIVIISYITKEAMQSRHFIPLLPSFALISAIGLDSLKNRKLRNLIAGFIFVIGSFQYFNMSFNQDIQSFKIYESPAEVEQIRKSYNIITAAPPYMTDWKHRDIVKTFAGHIAELGGYPLLVDIFIDDKDGTGLGKIFNHQIMSYYFSKEIILSDFNFESDIFLYLYDITMESERWAKLKEPKPERGLLEENKRFIDNILKTTGLLYISRKGEWPNLDELNHFFDDQKMHKRLMRFLKNKERFSPIGKISLPKGYYANLYLYKIPEVRKNNLSIRMFNGRVKIYYKDKEITKETGIMAEVVYNGKVYKGSESELVTYNETSDRVTMVARWKDLGIIQTTTVSMDPEKEGTLNIKVNMESGEDITIDEWYIKSLISNEYKEWMRPFSKGVFKEIGKLSDGFKQMDRRYEGPNIVGIKKNVREGLPSIVFKPEDIGVSMRMGISNTDYYYNSRCISMNSDTRIELRAGEARDILDMDIRILEGEELEDLVLERVVLPDGRYIDIKLFPEEVPEIRSGDLSVKVYNGKVKVFYKDKEITKEMGITSEFVYNDKVYKCYKDAIWGFYNILPERVTMVAIWHGTGIRQTATVSMDSEREGTLNIKVNMESGEDITIDEWYINSLISNEYKEWMRPFKKGVFKEITEDSETFEALDLDYEGPNIVGIPENIERGLPFVLFKEQNVGIPMRAGVSNTNYYHNARCIYITADTAIRLKAGETKDILDMDIEVMEHYETERFDFDYSSGL